jgi:hypothetical protein
VSPVEIGTWARSAPLDHVVACVRLLERVIAARAMPWEGPPCLQLVVGHPRGDDLDALESDEQVTR